MLLRFIKYVKIYLLGWCPKYRSCVWDVGLHRLNWDTQPDSGDGVMGCSWKRHAVGSSVVTKMFYGPAYRRATIDVILNRCWCCWNDLEMGCRKVTKVWTIPRWVADVDYKMLQATIGRKWSIVKPFFREPLAVHHSAWFCQPCDVIGSGSNQGWSFLVFERRRWDMNCGWKKRFLLSAACTAQGSQRTCFFLPGWESMEKQLRCSKML